MEEAPTEMTDQQAPRTTTIRQLIEGPGRHSGDPNDYEMRVKFLYRTDHPYSFHLRLGVKGHSEWVRSWEVSREVFAEAFATAKTVGIGDFQVGTIAPSIVLLRLLDPKDPTGRTCLDMYLPRNQVRSFLARSLAMVPAGREPERLNLDRHLAELFA
jgi:sporulation and cell division protein SsgA